MKPSEIIELLEKSDRTSYGKYNSWTKINANELSKLEFIGEIEGSKEDLKEIETEINYWDKKYPISFHHYPYSHCKIYRENNKFFMVYKDFAGHAPELRIRLISLELLI